jgi:flagellar biosynthesis/type III secretory pathway M-ring protein FliF/YscJ
VLDLYAKLSQEYTIKATQNRIIENQRDSLTIINKSERRAKEEAIEAKEKESMANEALNKSNEIQKRLSYVLSFFILLVIFLLWQQIQLKLKERKLKEEERDKKQQVIEEIKNMAPNEAYYNHIYSKLS